MVKNPNWQEADQLAIYKRGQGVELGATKLAVRAGLESRTSGFQVQCPKHLTIDLFHKWQPINYSFIFVEISLTKPR